MNLVVVTWKFNLEMEWLGCGLVTIDWSQ